jgi:hypothetical protein
MTFSECRILVVPAKAGTQFLLDSGPVFQRGKLKIAGMTAVGNRRLFSRIVIKRTQQLQEGPEGDSVSVRPRCVPISHLLEKLPGGCRCLFSGDNFACILEFPQPGKQPPDQRAGTDAQYPHQVRAVEQSWSNSLR